MCLWKRKSRCILNNCLSHLPCVSHLVSFFCVSLPPSFLCLIYTLSLPLALSDTLLSKSRLLCCELVCDLFLIFISTLLGGRWTKAQGQDTFTCSITACCSWQELGAGGSVVWRRQCRWSALWPEKLGLCEEGEATHFLLGRLVSWKLSQLSLVRGLEQDGIPNYRIVWKWEKDPINISQRSSRNLHHFTCLSMMEWLTAKLLDT